MLNMLPARVFPFMTDYQLSGVPLFIFMAAILEKAVSSRSSLTSSTNGSADCEEVSLRQP